MVAERVKRYLTGRGVPYAVLLHAPAAGAEQAAELAAVPVHRTVRCEVLGDEEGALLAVFPADAGLDLRAAALATGRRLRPLAAGEAQAYLPDCEPGAWPATGGAYGLPVLVDDRVGAEGEIYFQPGRSDHLVYVRGGGVAGLFGEDAVHCNIAQVDDSAHGDSLPEAEEVRRSITRLERLPPLPVHAHALLRLRGDPEAGVGELAQIVEQDPALAAQVLRYAGSSFYGYRGQVADVSTAIARVLGYDFVLHLALGLAIGTSLQCPAGGPLGWHAHWRHAVYSAVLSQRLARLVPAERRPSLGSVYLAGLLHDIGFLVLGHLYPERLRRLNRLLEREGAPLTRQIEKAHFGVSHDEAGGWLFGAWGLPDEFAAVASQHHSGTAAAPHVVLVSLVALADRLLKTCDIGDAGGDESPEEIMAALDIDAAAAEMALRDLLDDHAGLDLIARQLAA